MVGQRCKEQGESQRVPDAALRRQIWVRTCPSLRRVRSLCWTLDFKRRRAQGYTCRHQEPPNPPQPTDWTGSVGADWAGSVRWWRASITLDRASLPSRMFSESELWYVGFHTAEPREVYRADPSGTEFDTLISSHLREIVIEREFESSDEPASWTIWAYGKGGTWLDRIDGKFTDANASLTASYRA
jgi:hypothetical protein